MGKILRYFLAVLPAALSSLTGFNTTGCLQNQSSVPLAGFFASSTGESIRVDSLCIFGIGAPNDSSLISGTAASMVYLPLRSSASETSFCIRYLQKALDFPEFNDTISIGYTSEPKFVSEECGAMYCYNIDTVAHTCHFIDSVSVLEPYIDNIDVMRLKIYFRTTADDDTPEEDDNESDEPHL